MAACKIRAQHHSQGSGSDAVRVYTAPQKQPPLQPHHFLPIAHCPLNPDKMASSLCPYFFISKIFHAPEDNLFSYCVGGELIPLL